MYDFLLDIFYEKGIVNILLDYKEQIEDFEIINDYNNNWTLINDFGIWERNISEKFIRNNINNLNINKILPEKKFSEDFIRDFRYLIEEYVWLQYLEKHTFSFSFILSEKLYLEDNFFFYYLLSKKQYKLFSMEEIFILISIIFYNKSIIKSSNITYFFKSLIKTQSLSMDFLKFILEENILLPELDEDEKSFVNMYINSIYMNKKLYILKDISINSNINYDIDFLIKYQKYLNIREISKNALYLNEDIIHYFIKEVSLFHISKNQYLSEQFIIKHLNDLSLTIILKNKYINLSQNFYNTYHHLFDINNFIEFNKIDKKTIDLNKDKIKWDLLIKNNNLEEYDILKYKNYININDVFFSDLKLSNEFIFHFSDKIDFDIFSRYRYLNDTLMTKYKKSLDWTYISKYQVLTKKQLNKYKNYLDWGLCLKYQKNVDYDMINIYTKE